MNNDRTVDQMPASASKAPDGAAVFKDMADVVRAKNVFFIPFFAAFLALLAGKSEFIKTSTWLLKLECTLTFLMGVYYAVTVTRLLWLLESLRLLFNVHMLPTPERPPEEELSAFRSATQVLIRLSSHENRIFRYVMWALYFTGVNLFIELFFRSELETLSQWLISGILQAFLGHGLIK